MDDGLHPLQRRLQPVGIGQAAENVLNIRQGVAEPLRSATEHPHPEALLLQLVHDVGSDEPATADNKNGFHGKSTHGAGCDMACSATGQLGLQSGGPDAGPGTSLQELGPFLGQLGMPFQIPLQILQR